MPLALEVVSHSEKETLGFAEKIVPVLRPGDVLILTGPLGSGKTVFVRGLAHGLGLDADRVNSPSFTIVNEYLGPRSLYHFDLYRVQNGSELYEIGWDDYLSREGLIAVEWGEKADWLLPPEYYLVEFDIVDEVQRRIKLTLVSA